MRVKTDQNQCRPQKSVVVAWRCLRIPSIHNRNLNTGNLSKLTFFPLLLTLAEARLASEVNGQRHLKYSHFCWLTQISIRCAYCFDGVSPGSRARWICRAPHISGTHVLMYPHTLTCKWYLSLRSSSIFDSLRYCSLLFDLLRFFFDLLQIIFSDLPSFFLLFCYYLFNLSFLFVSWSLFLSCLLFSSYLFESPALSLSFLLFTVLFLSFYSLVLFTVLFLSV